MAADDRYTIPGSGGVLKNTLNLTNQDRLDRAMNEAASIEWAIMRQEAIPEKLDLGYLREVHRRLLSPVLPWAGKMRQLGDEVIAGGTGIVYARSMFFRNGLEDVFSQLASEDFLRGLEALEFADRLADRWGYLTTTHPFRDGNTRSQSAYVDRLAVRAGHPIDWVKVDVPTLRSLRLSAMSGSEAPLAEYLYEHLAPQRGAELDGSHSSYLFTAGDPVQASGIQSPRAGASTAGLDLTKRYRRFPELRPEAMVVDPSQGEPQSDPER